jgi:hypothetical protein
MVLGKRWEGPTLAELQQQQEHTVQPTGMPKGTNKALKVVFWIVGIWVFIGWAWGLYFTIMFDLGLGHVGSFSGANAPAALVAALLTLLLAIAKSPRRFMTLSRIVGWTVLQSALVGAVVFTLVKAYIPTGNTAAVAGDLSGTALLVGLIGNSLRQMRLDKKDSFLRQLHATTAQL